MTPMEQTQRESIGGASQAGATYDPDEVGRFARMAAEWWDPNGKFKPLHRLGPARLQFIRDDLIRHFGLATAGRLDALSGLRVLDVGCGGGLIAEPLARLGARVTGIEPAEESIAAARLHADKQGLSIDYRVGRVEDLIEAQERFDAVVCLEVLEHVPDPAAFLAMIAKLVEPGGLMILSTLNRTLKSYALAIVATEYVLGWLPVGTHQWERFITPDELSRFATAAGLDAPRIEGLVYQPLSDTWRLGPDSDVNYMASAARPAATPAI